MRILIVFISLIFFSGSVEAGKSPDLVEVGKYLDAIDWETKFLPGYLILADRYGSALPRNLWEEQVEFRHLLKEVLRSLSRDRMGAIPSKREEVIDESIACLNRFNQCVDRLNLVAIEEADRLHGGLGEGTVEHPVFSRIYTIAEARRLAEKKLRQSRKTVSEFPVTLEGLDELFEAEQQRMEWTRDRLKAHTSSAEWVSERRVKALLQTLHGGHRDLFDSYETKRARMARRISAGERAKRVARTGNMELNFGIEPAATPPRPKGSAKDGLEPSLRRKLDHYLE